MNNSFKLSIPRAPDAPLDLSANVGEVLFVLGANGTGKSSLMHRFYTANRANALRISAHRQTWFSSNTISMSPLQKRQTEQQIQGQEASAASRWSDPYPGERANIAIYDLVDAENVRARSIAAAVDCDRFDVAKRLSETDSPLKQISRLLRLSNIPIDISVRENEQVVASKSGGPSYSVAELSDGERNALLIAASVLTAKVGVLILIDEPERHLHRSIISPLLTQLFATREDCAFVVSTHEVELPLDNSNARTLLIRNCKYTGSSIAAWDADVVSSGDEIGGDLRKDILGARRKILFVEGTERSLDKPLYSLVFPGVSVVSKASCRDVEHAVFGIREAADLHWVSAFGIVDSDRRVQADLDRLKAKGVYAVSAFSVESIYYHPEIQAAVAKRHASVIGGDYSERLASAKVAAIAAIVPHLQRLSERTAEREVREQLLSRLPQRKDILAANPIQIEIDVASIVKSESERLQTACDTGDLAAIIAQYPVRETPALNKIANELGFKNREQYEGAVRKLMLDDNDALGFVRSMFGTLGTDIDAV